MNAKEAKYVDYIKERYPQIEISKIEYNFVDGKHHDIVTVNDNYSFKFAKYDWSVSFVDNEASIISLISRYITMSLPRVESLDNDKRFHKFPVYYQREGHNAYRK